MTESIDKNKKENAKNDAVADEKKELTEPTQIGSPKENLQKTGSKLNPDSIRRIKGKIDKNLYNALNFSPSRIQEILGVIIITYLLEFTGIWIWAFIIPFLSKIFNSNVKSGKSFGTGFLELSVSWGIHMAYISFFDPIEKLNILLSLLGLNVGILIIITILIGGLLGGLGAWNGFILRKIISESNWFKNFEKK